MDIAKKITLLVCFSIYAVFILGILGNHDPEKASDIGLAGILLGVAYFFFGLVSMVSKQTRSVGSALLLSAGIIFLIGVSVCSANPIRI